MPVPALLDESAVAADEETIQGIERSKTMSPVKEAVIKLVESLPDDSTIEDIHYHLYVREKVLRGSRAIDEGRVESHEGVGRRLAEWSTSYGLTQQ
jgi:hypothetical protein